MIRFKIDSTTTSKIDRVTKVYNFDKDTVTGRIAVSISIVRNITLIDKIGIKIPQDGREYSQTSNLFGKILSDNDEILYRSVFNQFYEKELSEREFSQLYRLHLVDGINFWTEELDKIDLSRGEHIKLLSEYIKKGLNKRSSVYNRNTDHTNRSIKIQSSDKLIQLTLGTDESGNKIKIKINDEREFTSRHFGIAGTTGSGKTQLVLDLLRQIYKQSEGKLNFTFFDFKGTDKKEKLKYFLDSTNSNFIDVEHNKGFPFSPLKNYDLSNSNYIESFAYDLRTFFKSIGQVQSGALVRQIQDYYYENKKSPLLNQLLENLLERNDDKFDTTTSVIQQLINSGIYDENEKFEIFNKSTYISMPTEVTKEIKQFVTFNLLKFMFNTIKESGDSEVNNHIKELKHVVIIDEAQNFLQHKNARSVIEAMLRELRSMGIIIILIAQEINDFIYKDFDFTSQIAFPICANVKDKSVKKMKEFLGSVKSDIKLETELDKLESGNGIINIDEPKLISINQLWKSEKNSHNKY